MGVFQGIWGYPFLDLEPFLDLSQLPRIHEEICLGLCHVLPAYTGGSLKWMNIVAPSFARDPYIDYGHVISRFSREEFLAFVALSDRPEAFDVSQWQSYRFGDETEHPLSWKQMLYLKMKYRVYFPWKVCFHFLENVFWEDKHCGDGKEWSDEARTHFPQTVAFFEGLPFREIGRCVLFGLEANDHAPAHRDTDPSTTREVAHSMSISPAGDKRFFLTDPDETERIMIPSRAYWFNDMDYHGVEPSTRFQYSIRIDGVYEPEFLERIHRRLCQ